MNYTNENLVPCTPLNNCNCIIVMLHNSQNGCGGCVMQEELHRPFKN